VPGGPTSGEGRPCRGVGSLPLRLLGGPTAEVARAILVREATMAQRPARAKAKIRDDAYARAFELAGNAAERSSSHAGSRRSPPEPRNSA
jgi:hypothetical protein